MSQVVRYRQYWMATLKDRNYCEFCCDLAVSAEYTTTENAVVQNLRWLCGAHLSDTEIE
jgi:hypothetical protein